MPRRYVKKPRKVYRKKRYTSNKTFANKVNAVIKKTAEKKYVDWSLYKANSNSDLSCTSTGTLVNTTSIASIINGTGENKRIGDEIKLISLEVRGRVYMGASQDFNNITRIIILQWRQAQAELSTFWQIIQNFDVGSPTILSSYNPTWAGQFRILMDRRFNLSSAGASTISFRKVFHKLDKKIKFNSVSGQPIKDEIFIIAISDSGASPHPNLGLEMRVKFIDV